MQHFVMFLKNHVRMNPVFKAALLPHVLVGRGGLINDESSENTYER